VREKPRDSLKINKECKIYNKNEESFELDSKNFKISSKSERKIKIIKNCQRKLT